MTRRRLYPLIFLQKLADRYSQIAVAPSVAEFLKFIAEEPLGRVDFSPEECEEIKARFLTTPLKRLAADLDRDPNTVRCKAYKLGLRKRAHRKGTQT